MPRPSHARPDEEEEPEEDDEEDDDEDGDIERPPQRRTRGPARRGRSRPRPRPVRRWRAPGGEEDEETVSTDDGSDVPERKPVFWRARDSLFFEPLVALAIVVVLLVSLFAYTQNWPPVYVVESNSMQHGSGDQLGLINAGDLVLAQKTSLAGITPYVIGLQTGYSTYGEYGDVLLYTPNGQATTPIIHRAILFLHWDPKGFYNATDLTGLHCGNQPNAVYSTPGTVQGTVHDCNTTGLTGDLDLFHIGWGATNISLTLNAPALGRHSGFLTMGDNNSAPDQAGGASPELSELVEPGWIIGVARGMLPWFGSVKLLLEGHAALVPPQSWEFLGLTLVGAILVAFGIHYALRTEGIETPLRREEEEEERARGESGPERATRHHWYSVLHRRDSDDEEDTDEEEAPHRRRTRPPPSHASSRRGRPVPHIRRGEKSAKKHDRDDEL